MMHRISLLVLAPALLLGACKRDEPAPDPAPPEPEVEVSHELLVPVTRLDIYREVDLSADLSHLSDEQHGMLRLLIRASDIMDGLFWRQSFGNSDELLDLLDNDAVRRFAEINYGPWDRLDNNRPFLSGFDDKPEGARFYPEDLGREEFEMWDDPDKDDPYSFIRRDGYGNLEVVPYRELFAVELAEAAKLLRRAAGLAESEAFAHYLRLRADALVSDDYRESDLAWMDVRDNPVELVIGPIENYEDRLFGIRTAFESFVLIKDLEWSARLNRYAAFLPELQRRLPVADAYRAEEPGSEGDLNAYDAIYYAGDANAGSKTIAINLPNDEHVQLAKGTRRLQIKNAMRAKFDHILVPIAAELISADQRAHIRFDAFFANVMFHEVAHGLGIKHLVGEPERTVRAALAEQHGALEEGKADVLGLFMIGQLADMNEWEAELMDHYVTFVAGIFRSVRFGGSSAHGRANLAAFNYLSEAGAIAHDPVSGTWRVEAGAFPNAVNALSRDILMLQGDGDREAAAEFFARYGNSGPELTAGLERVHAAGIPVDIVFRQGPDITGL